VEEDQHSKLPGLNKPLPCGRHSSGRAWSVMCLGQRATTCSPTGEAVLASPSKRVQLLVRGEESKGVQTYGLSDRNMNTIWRGRRSPRTNSSATRCAAGT